MVENNFQSVSSTVRMPPQNLEAERGVLGSIMLDGAVMHEISDLLTEEDFYHEKHALIFDSILGLYKNHDPIDFLSVSNKLKEKKNLDKSGGSSYLTELIQSVPTASNVKYYAEIVHKKRILRDLIESSHHISHLGYKEEEDVDHLIDEAEKKIFGISRSFIRKKFISVKHALEEAWERIDKLHKSKGELRGVPTGFQELDNKLAGFQKSDLIILAARPSLGKTALALDIARQVAIGSNIPVGIFSLEMSSQQLVDRLLASESHVDSWKLRTGRISSDDEFSRIRDAMEKISKAPIFIDDEPGNNIMKMRGAARRLQAEHGLGLIIVDYLQLMAPQGTSDSIVQQMTEISRSLKGLARELDVPVLALSQLSRAVESRNPPIPRLHDLRDSGSIEQDADVVMFIYREDRYKENTDRPNIADIFIEKHRNGPTGKIELYFNQSKVSFSSIERGDFGKI
jgi:replicative DNA helicase